MKDGEFEVLVVDVPAGIIQGCKICRQVLKTGKFLIGIHLRDDGQDFKYFLGASPEQHCGTQKTFLASFESEEDAQAEGLRVHDLIVQAGTTEGLPLMGFFDPNMN